MIFSILYRQEKTRRYFSFYYTYFYVCFSSARNTPCAGNFRRGPLPSRRHPKSRRGVSARLGGNGIAVSPVFCPCFPLHGMPHVLSVCVTRPSCQEKLTLCPPLIRRPRTLPLFHAAGTAGRSYGPSGPFCPSISAITAAMPKFPSIWNGGCASRRLAYKPPPPP